MKPVGSLRAIGTANFAAVAAVSSTKTIWDMVTTIWTWMKAWAVAVTVKTIGRLRGSSILSVNAVTTMMRMTVNAVANAVAAVNASITAMMAMTAMTR